MKCLNNLLLYASVVIFELSVIKSARILIVVITPSYSHSLFFHPIIMELSRRGHQVVSITPDPIHKPELTNLTEIVVHNESYSSLDVELFLNRFKAHQFAPTLAVDEMLPSIKRCHDAILSHPQVQQLIFNHTKEHFDLYISEMHWTSAINGFAELYQVPFIGMVSLDLFLNVMDTIGNPSDPNYFVDILKTSSDMSFLGRLERLLHAIHFRLFIYWKYIPEMNRILAKHFGDYINHKDINEIEKNVDLILVNSNPIFYPPRPLVPSVIPIGGLHSQNRKPLPTNLKLFLDNASEGAIYFSLGSNIKSKNLGTETFNQIIKTFERLPFKILWKWEDSNFSANLKNVLTQSWVPQQDVLDHPNIKLFITQGGLQSMEEAIESKVPMIGIPFGGDQNYNTDRVQSLEIGKQLQLDYLTEETLFQTILEVINNPKYKQNIIKLSGILEDQQTKPLERAIWWIEYVLRHGDAKHLRSPAVDLPLYKYLMLDLILFLILCVFIVLLLIFYFLKFIIKTLQLNKKIKFD